MAETRPACALAAFAFLGVSLCTSSPAYAWGASGHRMIGEVAAQSLPPEIPAFLRSADAARKLGELAREPDRSKGAGVPHDPDLDPGHFVDIGDDGRILGGPLLAKLPATREIYDSALRAVHSDQYKAGYLPYSIVEGWQQLVQDFGYWRADEAAARTAAKAADRQWFADDRALRETLVLRDLGIWSHFVGDGSQPMHASVHFNGWGDYPNPERFSKDRKIHARFEGAFVRANIVEADIRSRLVPYRDCQCTIQERVGQYLAATNAQVVPFYRLEKASAFDGRHAQGKAFAAARLAAASSELRDLVIDAWRLSDTVSVGFPPVSVRDVEAGKLDAAMSFKGAD